MKGIIITVIFLISHLYLIIIAKGLLFLFMAEGVIGQRFQKLSCISKDNTGRVFLAQDLETNSCVALKIEQISSKSLLEIVNIY